MKIINLPNIITCLNLLCGCLAIYFAFHAQVDIACLLIVAGAVFDFFDGMTARLLKVSSPVGKELDSLADVVTFGIAPSVLCYTLMVSSGWSAQVSLVAFLMAAFSALRLAKFNVDERQTTSFIGLPTPANALFWIGMVYLCHIPVMSWLHNPWILLFLMLGLSWMLISEIPMFSLKFKFNHLAFGDNWVQYSFLIAAVALIVLFSCLGHVAASLAVIILLYVLISIFTSSSPKQ